ncbi:MULTISPECIES: hypothetical protein [Olleya]|uniref:Uncharacterized protein n=1 Tax=Olleya namhaensis TaxID=1144750 RepID=A0A1I3KPF8_9FLAO|nr:MULTISPECIES: hypothetical protein [Olleya]PKG49705.1 hypothetical protein CXF54_13355 [Olleya sp. 1-3]SFI74356.1 hypothetical protein SAMN05443431_10265 [Olleya namhaensis]
MAFVFLLYITISGINTQNDTLKKSVNVINTECATSKLVEECHLDKNELSELICNEIINLLD